MWVGKPNPGKCLLSGAGPGRDERGIGRRRRFGACCPVENMGKDNLRAGPSAVLDVPAFKQELITIRDLESGCRSSLTGLVDEPIAPWS